MDTRPITPARLAASVIAVPPLARDAAGHVEREQNGRLIRHLEAGGVTTLLYGGNASFYHLRPSEYHSTLELLSELAGAETLVVPAVGPSFGVMMDQAAIAREFDFPTVMVLPPHRPEYAGGCGNGLPPFRGGVRQTGGALHEGGGLCHRQRRGAPGRGRVGLMDQVRHLAR